MRRRFSIISLLILGLVLGIAGTAEAATAPLTHPSGPYASSIYNFASNPGNLGVIHGHDGVYGNPPGCCLFDIGMPADAEIGTYERYGWAQAAGFYIGHGAYSQLYWYNGTVWVLFSTQRVSCTASNGVQYFFGNNTVGRWGVLWRHC